MQGDHDLFDIHAGRTFQKIMKKHSLLKWATTNTYLQRYRNKVRSSLRNVDSRFSFVVLSGSDQCRVFARELISLQPFAIHVLVAEAACLSH